MVNLKVSRTVKLRDLQAKLTASYQRARFNNPAINAVMASPPTVTISATVPSAPYAKRPSPNPVAVSDFAGIARLDGGWPVVNTGSGQLSIRAASNPTTATPDYGNTSANIAANQQNVGRFTFVTDAASPILAIRNNSNAIYRVIVDGQYTDKTAGYTTAGTDGTTQYMTIAFGSRKFRTITLETQGDGNYGSMGGTAGYIYVGPTDTIYAPQNGLRGMVLGCSYTVGPTQVAPIFRGDGWARVMGDCVGVDDLWQCAINGAGFAVTNNDLSNRYKDVLQAAFPPDFILFDMALALNDTSVIGTIGDAPYQAIVQTLLSGIRTGLNALSNVGVPIIVMGGQQGTSSLATQQRVDNDIEAAVTALADDRMAVVRNSLLTQPWISGTGSSTATTGDGNADIYKLTDKTHMTTAGHQFFGQRAAGEVVKAINAMS